jgi:hypothetical protein
MVPEQNTITPQRAATSCAAHQSLAVATTGVRHYSLGGAMDGAGANHTLCPAAPRRPLWSQVLCLSVALCFVPGTALLVGLARSYCFQSGTDRYLVGSPRSAFPTVLGVATRCQAGWGVCRGRGRWPTSGWQVRLIRASSPLRGLLVGQGGLSCLDCCALDDCRGSQPAHTLP